MNFENEGKGDTVQFIQSACVAMSVLVSPSLSLPSKYFVAGILKYHVF